jgi:Cu-Zn family superoxide dismutase
MIRTAAALIALLAAGTAAAEDRTAAFIDAQGREIGSATLRGTPSGVLILLDVTGLPPGVHALHVHQTGICDAAGGFKSAGAHFDGGHAKHGFMAEGGPHAGDIPNQTADETGHLKAEVMAAMVALDEHSLLDADGSALVIHTGPDDYMTDPSGGSGDRIACAAVTAPGAP